MAFYGISSGLGEWSNISGDLFLGKKRENNRIVWNDDVLHATSY